VVAEKDSAGDGSPSPTEVKSMRKTNEMDS